jgi:hypothetical protein
MALTKIYQGENNIILWPLLQRSGQPLALADLTMLFVEFIQNNIVVQKYVYLEDYESEDPEIRLATDGQGLVDVSAGNVLEVEYTRELTERLRKHKTYLKVTLRAPNPYISVDADQQDEFMVEIFEVV